VFDNYSGKIFGIPNVLMPPESYSITAFNDFGQTTVSITVTINPEPVTGITAWIDSLARGYISSSIRCRKYLGILFIRKTFSETILSYLTPLTHLIPLTHWSKLIPHTDISFAPEPNGADYL